MPVIRTLARFIESFVFYSIDFFPDIRTFHAGYRDMPDIRILYWKTVALYHIFYAGYKNMFLDNEYRLEEHTGSKNHRLKMVLIYTYIMYVGYTNIFSTPKSILISDIHCIRHAGYKNIGCNSQRCSYNRHDCISVSKKGIAWLITPFNFNNAND